MTEVLMTEELETGAVDPRSCHKLIITGLQTDVPRHHSMSNPRSSREVTFVRIILFRAPFLIRDEHVPRDYMGVLVGYI